MPRVPRISSSRSGGARSCRRRRRWCTFEEQRLQQRRTYSECNGKTDVAVFRASHTPSDTPTYTRTDTRNCSIFKFTVKRVLSDPGRRAADDNRFLINYNKRRNRSGRADWETLGCEQLGQAACVRRQVSYWLIEREFCLRLSGRM